MFVPTGNESESYASFSSSVQWSQLCRHFEFGEILSATENFNELLVIGRGGTAKVYKGNIYNGSSLVVAAIKRLDSMSNEGESEFWAEVEMLSKLRHCHLVSLIGYCNHETEMILVYEYIPLGTLGDHLHKLGTPLSWCERLKICIGAARGLDYLHTGTGIDFGVIHRDVKSSNILLDESWGAKISDFGLSKISPRNQSSTYVSTLVKGTFGYFDPNYFATGKLTRKSDVYAFGVVLLEVLCRKRAVDDSLDYGIATWAQDSIKEGRLKDIVDSDIRGEISPKCLKQFARIAERCLNNHPNHRPTMAEVVLSLEYLLTLQETTNNLLQTAGKTIFDRMVDKFSSNGNRQNSGTEFGPFMPKKPNIGMNFGSLIPKKRKQHMLREKLLQKNGNLLLEEKIVSGLGPIKLFGIKELERSTMNFAENMIIGRGVSGFVYKGVLADNRSIAIKRPRRYDETLEDFINEIVILGQIIHRNVVHLLGYCLEIEVPLLVYEFYSNGNLHQHIHDNGISTRYLSWDSRLRIAHESAGALAYLHTDATKTIMHSYVKSSNILLDENYSAKVADFGVSKPGHLDHDHVTMLVRGMMGYLDPEYFHTSQLTYKSDVYSFGVVLAELITGLNPIDSQRSIDDINLATYFMKANRENQLSKIVDHHVLKDASDVQLEAACKLVCRCLEMNGWKRPNMKTITMELERIRRLSIHQPRN